MRPIITVSPDEAMDRETHRPLWLVKRSYALAIAGAGGSPIMAVEPRFFREYAERTDGLLLTGGAQRINPARFGECVYPGYGAGGWYGYGFSYTRDSMDISLCQAFLEVGKPIMGIGRGMHIINIVLGGTLYQELSVERPQTHPEGASHGIKVCKGSVLTQLVGCEATVNSYHKQAIKTLGEGLEEAAYSDDGLIEAIWHRTLPVFGVQWNPETHCTDDDRHFARQGASAMNTPPLVSLRKQLQIGWQMMKPLAGAPTDADTERPTDNALFNYFIRLCSREGQP